MSRKKRMVDVVSVNLRFLNNEHDFTFVDVLNELENSTKYLEGKSINFKKIPTDIEGCTIGLITTTQDRDIPPKCDKSSGLLSQVNINPSTEGLAFANILIYDSIRNILIYEINRNGCYLRLFVDFIYAVCRDNYPDVPFDIKFPAVLKSQWYERMLNMTYYQKFKFEIYNPVTLINHLNEENDSLENCLKSFIEAGRNSGANSITIEQKVKNKPLNPNGLSRQWMNGIVNQIKGLLGTDYWQDVETFEITGYATDQESNNKRTTINVLVDSFREQFYIPEILIQSDLQQEDRKEGIEGLYNRLLPEFNRLRTP